MSKALVSETGEIAFSDAYSGVLSSGSGASVEIRVQTATDAPQGADKEAVDAPSIFSLTVGREVVEALYAWRPILRKDKWHLRFALYQIRSSHFAEDTGRLILGEPNVLQCYGYTTRYRSGNVPSAVSLLKRYRDEVDGELAWTKYDEGRARQMVKNGIPQYIRDLHEAFLTNTDPEKERVYVPDDGEAAPKKVNAKSRKERRDAKLHYANAYQPATAPPDVARRWQSYLNSRNSLLFNAVRANVDKAIELASAFENEHRRSQALRGLEAIDVDPMPVYLLSDYSARLQAFGESLQGIDSDLRRLLYPSNWIELDLAKAQLAIAAKDWGNLPTVIRYLEEAKRGEMNIWGDLVRHVGLEDTKAVRKAMKGGTYAAVYGSGEENVLWEMQKAYNEATGAWLEREAFRLFLTHSIIAELLDARESVLDEIRLARGRYDCFGRFISMEACTHKKDNRERSVLAQVAQARELDLLTPVLDLAEAEDGEGRPAFQIVLYQFDGVTLSFWKERDMEKHLSRIKSDVERYADVCGYLTFLEQA